MMTIEQFKNYLKLNGWTISSRLWGLCGFEKLMHHVYHKRFDTTIQCLNNNENHGIKISCLLISNIELNQNINAELSIIAQVKNGSRISLKICNFEVNEEVFEKQCRKLLKMLEYAANLISENEEGK